MNSILSSVTVTVGHSVADHHCDPKCASCREWEALLLEAARAERFRRSKIDYENYRRLKRDQWRR